MQTSTITKRPWQTTLLTGLLTLLCAGAALAQQMNYQGRLTDANGNAVPDAQYAITFDIYDSATAGNRQWGPQVIPADTVQGRFNVILGPTDATSRSIVDAFNGGNKYLQITFQGNPILPRQQILSSPTAFFAQQAGQLASVFVLNGNVGIGTTTPGFPLNFPSTVGDKISLFGESGNHWGLGIQSGQLQIHSDTVGGDVTFGYGNSAAMTETMRIKGNGKVGIGTSNPAFALHVQDPGTNTSGRIHVGSRTAGATPKLISFGDGNFVTLGENGKDDTMELRASTFYFNTGNVGIGITNPAAKLDVNGSVNVSGAISISGGITTGSGANAMLGHAPLIVEAKTPANQTLWDIKEIDVTAFANRPGGFKIRIYAQHETNFEVRNHEGTMLFEQSGYVNGNANYPNTKVRGSVAWIGGYGTTSFLLGHTTANPAPFATLLGVADDWVRVHDFNPGALNGGSNTKYNSPLRRIFVSFHPHVSGQVIISDN